MTLSIPEELRAEMEKFPEMNWSEIARAAIKQRILMLRKFKSFVKDSEFNEEDALRLGRAVNKKIAKRYAK